MDPSQITPSTPAIPPPPGVTSNFVNPHTRAPVAIIFISIAISLMWLVVMTRLYSKAWILRSFGWDDGIDPTDWKVVVADKGDQYVRSLLG